MKKRIDIGWLATAALLLGACSGGGASEGRGASCSDPSPCGPGEACIVASGTGACSLSCTTTGNECSGTASCEGVGSLSANYCQPPPPSAEEPDGAPRASEEPHLRCSTDAQCDAIERGAVCALFAGDRECTVPCTARSQCNPPTLAGITVDFYACLADEGDRSRTVCVLDPACLGGDPLACVTIDTPTMPPDPFDPFDPMPGQ